MKKQKNLIKRDRFYCIAEDPFDGFVKLGISDADAGQNNGPEDWYERLRALHQGNRRKLIVEWFIPIKGSARKFEKRVAKECRKKEIVNVFTTDRIVGHGEWWEMTPAQAREIANDVYNSMHGIVQDESLFSDENGNQFQIGY